jgi:orsellinic acid C2-O-methyltransferase
MSDAAQYGPAETVMQLCNGYRVSQALYVAAQLQIAEHLATCALSSADLAQATRTHAPSLRRLMRTLTALGVFSEPQPDTFALTPTGELLRNDRPGSLRALVLFMTGPARWQCWGDLLGSVRSGEPASARVLGTSIFEYYAAHPEESAMHDHALAAQSALQAAAIVSAYDFTRFQCVVDVGGGSGRLLAEMLKACPALTGVLFDLPHVAGEALALLARQNVADRCRIASGNFFHAVPEGGDAYLLKHVIHDWDDGRATVILAACRRVMGADGTLLLCEHVLPERAEHGQAEVAFLLDLEMLAMTSGGSERTEGEFRRLLAAAGFHLERIVETVCPASPVSIIEARPA